MPPPWWKWTGCRANRPRLILSRRAIAVKMRKRKSPHRRRNGLLARRRRRLPVRICGDILQGRQRLLQPAAEVELPECGVEDLVAGTDGIDAELDVDEGAALGLGQNPVRISAG